MLALQQAATAEQELAADKTDDLEDGDEHVHADEADEEEDFFTSRRGSGEPEHTACVGEICRLTAGGSRFTAGGRPGCAGSRLPRPQPRALFLSVLLLPCAASASRNSLVASLSFRRLFRCSGVSYPRFFDAERL